MYTDKYYTFDTVNMQYYDASYFQETKVGNYLAKTKPTYEIQYGDTVTIPFKISHDYADSNIAIILYDFRHETVYELSTVPDKNDIVYLVLDTDVSSKLHRGVYTIQIQAQVLKLVGEGEELEPQIVSAYTILKDTDCTLYIK